MSSEKIAIIGMGPGGLSAAIGCVKKGIPVTLFENREFFTRSQRVLIFASARKQLDKLASDNVQAIMEGALKEDYSLTSKEEKDLKFLQNKNKTVKSIQNYMLEKLTEQYPNLIQIERSKNLKINNVSQKNNTIDYTIDGKNKQLKFKHLVAADGARRTTSQLLNNEKNIINYKNYKESYRHEQCGTVTLKMTGDKLTDFKRRSLNYKDLKKLQENGWSKDYLPNIYLWPCGKNKCYFAGEVPENILSMNPTDKKEAMVNWAKMLVTTLFEYPEEKISEDIKSKHDTKHQQISNLKTTAFNLRLSYSEIDGKPRNCMKVSEGHHYVMIGDASRSANFFMAHGATDAIIDGKVFSECLDSDLSFDETDFIERNDKRVTSMAKSLARSPALDTKIKNLSDISLEDLTKGTDRLQQLTITVFGNDELFSPIKESLNNKNYEQAYVDSLALFDLINDQFKHMDETLFQEIIDKMSVSFDETQNKKVQEIFPKISNYQSALMFQSNLNKKKKSSTPSTQKTHNKNDGTKDKHKNKKSSR